MWWFRLLSLAACGGNLLGFSWISLIKHCKLTTAGCVQPVLCSFMFPVTLTLKPIQVLVSYWTIWILERKFVHLWLRLFAGSAPQGQLTGALISVRQTLLHAKPFVGQEIFPLGNMSSLFGFYLSFWDSGLISRFTLAQSVVERCRFLLRFGDLSPIVSFELLSTRNAFTGELGSLSGAHFIALTFLSCLPRSSFWLLRLNWIRFWCRVDILAMGFQVLFSFGNQRLCPRFQTLYEVLELFGIFRKFIKFIDVLIFLKCTLKCPLKVSNEGLYVHSPNQPFHGFIKDSLVILKIFSSREHFLRSLSLSSGIRICRMTHPGNWKPTDATNFWKF